MSVISRFRERDCSEDHPFGRGVAYVQPFRQGHVVNGDEARVGSALSQFSSPPSENSVLVAVRLTNHIEKVPILSRC